MADGQDKKSEREFYERFFRRRGRFDQFQQSIYRRIAGEARAVSSGTRALDLGCGSGDQAVCLSEAGFQVVACDLSYQAARLAGRRGRESDCGPLLSVNSDAEQVPLPAGSIDVCVCGLLLHHFGDLETLAGEIRRVLRPGGAVVAVDANAHNPFSWLFLNVVHRLYPLSGLTSNQRALGRAEIERVFAAQGFGDFRFSSMTSDLRRDWLGDSLGARLNYYTRATLLRLSRILLPQIRQGNMLLSVFRLQPER
ncbi:MAG: class I SAM-dependent methyltransferase [Thermoanaerobaculia bacterium]